MDAHTLEIEVEPDSETDIEADAGAGGSYQAASSAESEEEQPLKLDRVHFVHTKQVTQTHRHALARAMNDDLYYE